MYILNNYSHTSALFTQAKRHHNLFVMQINKKLFATIASKQHEQDDCQFKHEKIHMTPKLTYGQNSVQCICS